MRKGKSKIQNPKSKVVIGLTGLIASGKTTAAKALRRRGVCVIDVDEFAHGLYARGKPLYNKLVEKYGRQVLGAGGAVDRKELAKIVFKGKKEYRAFCRLVFPALNHTLQLEIVNCKSKIVILDMAVLFESGFYRNADVIILVRTPAKKWAKRINTMKNAVYVRNTVKFQRIFSLNKKIALSDYILYNNKNKAALRRTAINLLEKVKGIYGYN